MSNLNRSFELRFHLYGYGYGCGAGTTTDKDAVYGKANLFKSPRFFMTGSSPMATNLLLFIHPTVWFWSMAVSMSGVFHVYSHTESTVCRWLRWWMMNVWNLLGLSIRLREIDDAIAACFKLEPSPSSKQNRKLLWMCDHQRCQNDQSSQSLERQCNMVFNHNHAPQCYPWFH